MLESRCNCESAVDWERYARDMCWRHSVVGNCQRLSLHCYNKRVVEACHPGVLFLRLIWLKNRTGAHSTCCNNKLETFTSPSAAQFVLHHYQTTPRPSRSRKNNNIHATQFETMRSSYIIAILAAILLTTLAAILSSLVITDLSFDIWLYRYGDRECKTAQLGKKVFVRGEKCHTFDQSFRGFEYQWSPRLGEEHNAIDRYQGCTLRAWAGPDCGGQYINEVEDVGSHRPSAM